MNDNDQMPKIQHSPEAAAKVDARVKKDDVTGQTDTTLKEMKARLKEVPHTSAGSNHDKVQYSGNGHKKRKRMDTK
jgi:hypothetical protein